MKKLVLIAAVSALALGVQAGVITLGSSWTAEHNSGGAVALTDESATGFTAATSKGAWMYQLASASDFTAEPFNIGDKAIMTFTTTMNAAAAQAEDLDYRFMMWDETNGGTAAVRMDWGAPAGTTMGVGVGDNGTQGSIGTYDEKEVSTAVPSNVFNASNEVSTVSMSVTRVATNVFNVSLTWDDIEISGTALSNIDGDAMDFISGVGIRINASAGMDNNFTVSDLSVEVVADAGTALTYQLGGDSVELDQGWDENVTTNSGATPTEYSWSFGAPYYYEELSNVLFTVTAVEANDAMYIQSTHLAGTNGNAARLDTNEMVTVKVSYVDPDNKLLDLKVHSVGPWWNTGVDEETLFSDGSIVYAFTNTANGFMKSYDSMGLEQLSLDNTATWSMSVYQTNNTTTSGLGGFKLEYTVDAEYIEPPVITNAPIGEVAFSSNWVFEVATTNMAVLASSADGFSVEMTNSASKRFMYQMGANSFDAPFQVGETATWSFTAGAGSTMAFNAESAGLQGSMWDSGIGSGNGVTFQVDWGVVDATYIRLGTSSVSGSGDIGAIGDAVDSVGTPGNKIDGSGKSADFVISMERTSPTDIVAIMSYDDLSVTNDLTISADMDSLNELGFRFRQTDDNALVISNMKLVITNPNFAPYDVWASAKGLTEGVNDGYGDDAENGGLGDGMDNLLEYALGGNPLVDDAAAFLPTSEVNGGFLNYIYKRQNPADPKLTYTVLDGTDLVAGGLNNINTSETVSGVVDGFETVTNTVSTASEDKQFMSLKVELAD